MTIAFRVCTSPLRGLTLALVAVLLLFSAPVRAQEPASAGYVGRRIGTVTVTIEGRPTGEAAVLDVIETRGGQALTAAAIRETITHLYGLGRFDDVQVDAERAPDGGVNLRYILRPIHSVSKVEFLGTLGVPEDTLRRRMVDRFGETPSVGRAADVAQTLEDYYHGVGYLAAAVKVAPPIIRHDPDQTTLVFDVDAGPRARVTSVHVAGQPLDPAADILSRLAVSAGGLYAPDALRQKLDQYIADMRHRGYYQATATAQPVVAPDKSTVGLTITAEPGPLVTVRYEGDTLPTDKLGDLVPIEREGSVDEDILEDSARRIVDYLNQQGYWKAAVPPPDRIESDGRLTIVFHITRGGLYHVAAGGLEVSGNQNISNAAIDERVSRPGARMKAGDPFIASRLDAIVGSLKALYQENGFPDADIHAAENEVAPGQVKPVIVIKEGQQVRVGGISLDGNKHIATAQLLKSVTRSREGAPYYAPNVAADRDAMLEQYLDQGYESATVTADVSRSADGSRANIGFKIVEGTQTIVDHILIVGNTRTNAAVIQRELRITPGKPLGYSDVLESQRRLSALGLFRRVRITELPHGSPASRDVVVTVEEALRTTIGYGGGAQVDRILRQEVVDGPAVEQFEFSPRGFFEIGRRNVGGRNRSISLYTRLSLRPNTDPADSKQFGFAEYRVVGTYNEPRAFGNYGDLTATAAVEQGVRSSFNFARKGVNAELSHRLSDFVRGSARYAFVTTRLFDEHLSEQDQITIDRVFPQVRISAFSLAAARDTRDDLLEPQKGALVSVDGTLAARALGSQIGFTKAFAQAFVFRNLGRPRLVFAGGARIGLARAFAETLTVTNPDGTTELQTFTDLPASERFFTGGDTSVRGYALDSVGAPDTINAEGFPIGGNGLVVLNAELRLPVFRDLGAALFMDGGNVFRRVSDISLTELRGGTGVGLRYHSPIGPIRLDLGFKMDRRVIAGRLEPRMALHFSIGEAF